MAVSDDDPEILTPGPEWYRSIDLEVAQERLNVAAAFFVARADSAGADIDAGRFHRDVVGLLIRARDHLTFESLEMANILLDMCRKFEERI